MIAARPLQHPTGYAIPIGTVCEICESTKALRYDHDHKTGSARGWLCNRCNLGIGFFSDNVVMLEKAILYITKH